MMLGFTLMVWITPFIVKETSAETETGLNNNAMCLIFSLLCATACLTADNVFKSDLNSGWLKYSYALPITPLMRAAVRTARLFITTAAGSVFCIINIAAICAFTGNPFSIGCIALQAASIDIVLLYLIINDFFVFSARDAELLKKAGFYVEFALTVINVGTVALFLKITGINPLENSADNVADILVSIIFKKSFFIILLLVMLLLIAADMAVTAYKLRSAETSSAFIKKNENPSESADAVLNRSNITSGFLYKEFKQNKALIIFIAAIPLGLTMLSFIMSAFALRSSEIVSGGILEFATRNSMRWYMLAFGAFIMSFILPSVFQGDDRKLWAYFTVSSPVGVKGFMYNKYILDFAINGLYMVTCYFMDTLKATLRYTVTGNESQNMMTGFIAVFYFLLFMCAFDIPFSVRFGAKKGSIIKTTVLILFTVILSVCFVLLPENITQKAIGFFIDIFNGKADNTAMLLTSFCPFIALAAYLLSYKISCKIFMKGVDDYDK